MKHLTLLRHAKSSWDDANLGDFDRPLSKRGRKNMEAVGAYLSDDDFAPDTILCSPAARTRETFDRLAAQLDLNAMVTFDPALYLAGPWRLLAQIRALPESADDVLIIGHNPGLEELAISLVDPALSDHASLARLKTKYPTGAIASYLFPIDAWSRLAAATGALQSFVRPRDLIAT